MNIYTLRVWVKEAGQKRGRVVFDFFLSHHEKGTPFEPIRESAAWISLVSAFPAGTLFKMKEQKHQVA